MPEATGGTALYLDVTEEGRPAVLRVDTGSADTVLFRGARTPEWEPNAGSVCLPSGRTIDLPGRNIQPSGHAGLRDIGVLGADYFLSGTVVLDLARGIVQHYPLGTKIGADHAWRWFGYDEVAGHIVCRAKVNDRPLLLMLDTGSPHLLWVHGPERLGDVRVTTSDVEGTPVHFAQGPITLDLGHGPHQVPALKGAFPYFAPTARALGGLNGLLGLSSLGDRVVFDAANRRIGIAYAPGRSPKAR
jgi:hypothetical protein